MKPSSFFLIALLLVVSGALLIFIPTWQALNYQKTIDSADIRMLDPKDRVQLRKDFALVENSFRTTLAQIVGGSFLLISLYLTYRNVKIAQENLRIVEEGKLTDRFSKAVELLGNDQIEIRLGGIYALERIARDSEKDFWTVMEVLTAFIREKTSRTQTKAPFHKTEELQGKEDEGFGEKKSPSEDVQAIMTVIGRREWNSIEIQRGLNLLEVYLRGINLNSANLKRAFLVRSDFTNAILRRANLSDARLQGANLTDAVLVQTNFSGANLSGAVLKGANLSGATFIYADVKNADLTDTKNLNFSSLSSARNHQEAILSPDAAKEFKKYLKKR